VGGRIAGEALLIALAVDEDGGGGVEDGAVPEVQERTVGGTGVRVEIVQGVEGGNAQAPQAVQEEGVPEVGTGEMNHVITWERGNVRT